MKDLLEFLAKLKAARIYFTLSQLRDDSILVEVAVPGERWEIEFMEDGTLEIEIFRSDGNILDRAALDDLFTRFSE